MAGYAPIGTHYDVMPIAPIDEYCVACEAGPVRLVVESRELTEELARQSSDEIADLIGNGRANEAEDHGASLHVYGAADGLEHLRFDCFENEPHYHYIHNAEHGMVIVRLDENAAGDPIAWTLQCLRDRLPEMLEFAGVADLAGEVRARYDEVRMAIDRVGDMLRTAHQRAILNHAGV